MTKKLEYKLVSLEEVLENNYPEADEYRNLIKDPWYDDLHYRSFLYEFQNGIVTRLVAVDGGEPEDQTFTRNWSWVVNELNMLASKL